jgi:hypothetical protein
LSIASALALIAAKKPKVEQSPSEEETAAAMVPRPITVDEVLVWLAQASADDKRQVAAALAQDTATMRKMLPAKALPAKATPKQIFTKSHGHSCAARRRAGHALIAGIPPETTAVARPVRGGARPGAETPRLAE